MRFEIILFLLTVALVYNTYYDGRLINMIKIDIKYFKISCYILIAFVIYIFIKKQPLQSKSLLIHANDLIKYMPIDRQSKNIISPLLDYTRDNFLTNNTSMVSNDENDRIINKNIVVENIAKINNNKPQFNRMLNSGGSNNKRSVSETKKKYVASSQSWKCGHCKNPLDHTFEVDHILDLQYGGDNNVNNLIALCRNCHGIKTMESKL